MKITLSAHAEARLLTRLSSLVSRTEVITKIEKVESRLTDHRNFVMIKKIRYTEIPDSEVKPDGLARGDMVVAIVENGIVETVLLRKSWSKNSNDFRKIIH